MQPKWITRFMQMAELVASWSKDPSTQVGAVIVDDKQRVVSVGFNGFPRGVQDNHDVPRDTKLARTIHAEANAILFANRPLAGCSLFVTRPPCANCAALIIQTGIGKVFIKQPDADFMARWGSSVSESTRMFVEAGIEFQMLADATADCWIDWHGGACPVPGDALVQWKIREDGEDGERYTDARPAGEWVWDWDVEAADIVAYRVVKGR